MKKYAILLLSLLALITCESDDPIQYKLSTQVNPPEGGTISPSSGTINAGAEVTFKATPSDEYVFKSWSDDASGDENPMTAIMTDDMFVTANFEKKTYELTIEIQGQGTVREEIIQAKSSTDYPSGTLVQLTAEPDPDWRFVKWESKPIWYELDNPLVLTITSALSVTAVFLPNNGEKTYVPDDNFEQALIDLGYDDIMDDYVYTHRIKSIEELKLESRQIEDLTGIEDFENLKILVLTNNSLQSFDVSQNHMLEELMCDKNQLISLDISNISSIRVLVATENELSCIQVSGDQLFWIDWMGGPAELGFAIDEGVELYTDCSVSDDQRTFVPDDALEQALIDEGLDDVLDDYVKTIKIINRSDLNISGRNISDLTGLEDFIGLLLLDASKNNLTIADLSKWGVLWNIDLRNNPLTCVQINEAQQEVLSREMIIETDNDVGISLDCGY